MGEDAALACLSDRPAAALPLLQAALRTGDQPGHRLDPRAAGDVGLLDPGEPSGNLSTRRPSTLACSASSGRSSPTRSSPAFARSISLGLQVGDERCRCSSRWPTARRGLEAALSELCAPRPTAPGRSRGRQHPDSAIAASTPDHAPIPSLLATGAAHPPPPDSRGHTHPLRHRRARPVRPVKSAHFALLIGYGAGAVNPYLAFETDRPGLLEDGSFLPE